MRRLDHLSTLDQFSVKISGTEIPTDHIETIHIDWKLGKVSESGFLTCTHTALLITNLAIYNNYNIDLTGLPITISFIDPKKGAFFYQGIVMTTKSEYINGKLHYILSFDKEPYINATIKNEFKCYSNKTIVEIFKEFCQELNIEVYTLTDPSKFGTYWTDFCLPTVPNFNYLIDELKKDSLMYFAVPTLDNTCKIAIFQTLDLANLSKLQNTDKGLAIFSQFTDNKVPFIYAPSFDTGDYRKIQYWNFGYIRRSHDLRPYGCAFSPFIDPLIYSGSQIGADPDYYNKSHAETAEQIFNLKVENLITANMFKNNSTQFAEGFDNAKFFINNRPKTAMGSGMTFYPRGTFYRYRENYRQHKSFQLADMQVAPSIGMLCPMQSVQVFIQGNEHTDKNNNYYNLEQSGQWIISKSDLMISGNRMLITHSLFRPEDLEKPAKSSFKSISESLGGMFKDISNPFKDFKLSTNIGGIDVGISTGGISLDKDGTSANFGFDGSFNVGNENSHIGWDKDGLNAGVSYGDTNLTLENGAVTGSTTIGGTTVGATVSRNGLESVTVDNPDYGSVTTDGSGKIQGGSVNTPAGEISIGQ